MPVAKGERKIQHTDEQRAELVERVCEMYESQNSTLESCCEAAGISGRVFNLWCSKNSKFAERYKKAKEVQEKNYWENIIKPLQKKALQKHLEVEYAEDETEVVYQGVKATDDFGNPVRQRSKKSVLPNPTVLIFSMKGTYKEMFAERTEVTGPDGTQLFGISKAKQEDLEKLLDAINGE